jgi:hypothetical protein
MQTISEVPIRPKPLPLADSVWPTRVSVAGTLGVVQWPVGVTGAAL